MSSTLSPSISQKQDVTSCQHSVSNLHEGASVSLTRDFLVKEPSTDSDDELLRKMSKHVHITRGGRDSVRTESPVLSPSPGLQSTEHTLVDHSFLEETPSPTNMASKLVSTFRRSTSDILDDGERDRVGDPSQTIEYLNEKAKNGEPVVPQVTCDVAIRVSKNSTLELRDWFVSQLEETGLIVSSHTGYSGDYFLHVTAHRALFLKEAHKMELLKRVHPERGDGMKLFNKNEMGIFCPRQSSDGFLSAAERQLIIYNCLVAVRTVEPCQVSGVKFYHQEAVVAGLINAKIIKQIYGLHQKSKQSALNRLWVWNIFGEQPLHLVKHYFGEEIAMYFAWLGTYTFILTIPLLVGLLVNFVYDSEDVEEADWCFTFYAFFNVIWPTVFLELWKRRSSSLAWQWGTLGRDIARTDNERPQFTGTLGTNPVTKETELQYPVYKRQMKQAVSLVVSVLCVFVVLISMLAVFRFDDYIQYMTKSGNFPDYVPAFAKQFLKYTPKILLPITVGILDTLYSNIATSLNDWENYKHQRNYEDWLVLKLIMFKFVNHFLALFYTAFYLVDFEKLRDTLAALLITKQIVGNFGEVLGPSVTGWIKVYLMKRNVQTYQTGSDQNTSIKPTHVETESEKPSYDCTFDDYLEMFIQMGYVSLFSAAYPLAAVWAFLNNVVEIRSDAFKLVNGIKRPFMKRVQDIGFWQDAFEVLSVISIVVNCSLIGIRGQVGRWFPNSSPGQQILFVILMEHVFLVVKYIISRVIPDIPDWVLVEQSREQYKRSQAIKGLETLVRTSKLRGHMRRKVDDVRNRLEGMRSDSEARSGSGVAFQQEDTFKHTQINSGPSRYQMNDTKNTDRLKSE